MQSRLLTILLIEDLVKNFPREFRKFFWSIIFDAKTSALNWILVIFYKISRQSEIWEFYQNSFSEIIVFRSCVSRQ